MNLEDIRKILYFMIGEEELNHFITKRKEKHMTSDLIRQMFMTSIKEGVSTMTILGIAEVCSFGKDFDLGDYRDATLVTHGTNAWSAVFISTSDSGLVMLQKIAVATLLKNLIDLINGDQPVLTGTAKETNSWYPFELRSSEEIDVDTKKGDTIRLTLGW
jgi:hypothetical protein